MGSIEPLGPAITAPCGICGKIGRSTHHFIPRSIAGQLNPRWKKTHGNPTMKTCQKCHHDIHYYIGHWELAVYFNTVAKLKAELEKRRAVDVNIPVESEETWIKRNY